MTPGRASRGAVYVLVPALTAVACSRSAAAAGLTTEQLEERRSLGYLN